MSRFNVNIYSSFAGQDDKDRVIEALEDFSRRYHLAPTEVAEIYNEMADTPLFDELDDVVYDAISENWDGRDELPIVEISV